MRYFTIIKANIRKQKESFIGMLILIFIITVFLSAVLTIVSNSRNYEISQMDRLGYGDLVSWCVNQEGYEEAVEEVEALDEVSKVDRQNLIYAKYKINGTEVSNPALLVEFNPDNYDYDMFKDDFSGKKETDTIIKDGEIYVSPTLCSLYDAKIGDHMEVSISEDTSEIYTIAGFFEDPFMGSSMMGMKTFLVNEKDWEHLFRVVQETGADTTMKVGSMLHIFKADDCELSANDFQAVVIGESNIGFYAQFTYTKSVTLGFMLLLQDIFAGFLLVFVLILIVVALIVIGHSINSSIEQDYVNMGILKAVGYTKGQLRLAQILQYVIAIVIGILIGLPTSVAVIGIVNRITITATGLLIPDTLPAGLCGLFFAVIVGIILIFIYAKTTKIGRITPMRAIRGGVDNIYFESRITLPIYKTCLSFWIALRQLTSGKKQYVSAGLVTVLLVFFVSFVGRIDAWMGPNGEGLMESFGAFPYDLATVSDTLSEDEIIDRIEKTASIESIFHSVHTTVTIDGITYTTNVTDEPQRYNVLEGRTCKYDNEVLITEYVAKDLDVSVGDTITLSRGERNADYIISGINSCANDMGANCSMNMEGLAHLRKDAENYTISTTFILEDSGKKEMVVEDLKEYFGDKMTIDENTWSGKDAIVAAMGALEVLMYVIVVIFILVVTTLTGSKILYKEKQDMGIYKSLGFASVGLRLPFALRFGIVSCIGAFIGMVLSATLTDSMTTALLKTCGISEFHSELSLGQMLFSAVSVVAIFVVFAYIASRKIKKVPPAILIVE